jgi:uncharacterized protein (UPF0303 family)
MVLFETSAGGAGDILSQENTMSDLDIVREEERLLVLERFDEEVALAVGTIAYRRAVGKNLVEWQIWSKGIG